ncbi:MAG TPA: hypothetical protein VKG92_00985 [Flavobacteriales bacterium]|nr:hypothetical protein [Flavobacteriales bacterium]
MMHKAALTLIAGTVSLAALGQTRTPDSLSIRVAELHAVLTHADTIMWDEAWDDSLPINPVIEQRLLRVLAIPMADSTLERVTKHHFLQHARSKDGRLWAFNWYENQGGTFHSFAHVFFYRTADGRGIAVGDGEGFCDSRAPFHKIHPLRSKTHPGLYLGMATVKGCTSCCGDVAVIFQLIGDSLNLTFPAFKDDERYLSNPSQEMPDIPCYLLGARCGDLLQWEFDERKQRINYIFRVDDLSPIRLEDGENEGMVRGTLQFDGERFIEVMGKVEPDTYPQP